MRDGHRLVGHGRLLLRRDRSLRRRVLSSVHDDGQPARGDARQDLDVHVERAAAQLREPEAVFLDEVETQRIPAGWTRGTHDRLERDLAAWRHRLGQGGTNPVPDDRVATRVEPVVRQLQPVGPARAPGGGACVAHTHEHDRLGTSSMCHGDCSEPVRREWDRVSFNRHERRATLALVAVPLLVRALRREPVERTPVWFMRQAGRSLPEYRAVRERHGFFDVAGNPELCAEVTLQPVRRHDVDAAVLFADIMTPVLGMGVPVELVEGIGPVLERPLRTKRDVDRLLLPDPSEAFAPVLQAIRLVRDELSAEKALVGFSGGPFTVAAYLVEGRPSREFAVAKALMLGEPVLWDSLLERLAEVFAGYVAAQAAAGADAIQLFDSWVGALSPAQYRSGAARHSARVLAAVDVPTIHFGTGATHLLEELAAAGGDAIGLDWRTPLDQGWARVADRAVQGNLDPAALLAGWDVVEREALDVLDRAAGRPGHVFNLGHGVLPATDPDMLTRLAALVRERTEAQVVA